jgi:hypothetical protein
MEVEMSEAASCVAHAIFRSPTFDIWYEVVLDVGATCFMDLTLVCHLCI